jgi:hypothetical protein
MPMSTWLRRLRGALGMGVTWAVAWALAGAAFRLIVGPGTDDVPFPIRFGIVGFLAGVTFGGVLSAVARRRGFDRISLPGFAGWGALGGLALFGAFALTAGPGGESLLLAPLFAFAGAASAAGTLALARQGGRRELLGAGPDGVGRLPEKE